jgi:hypothetical protein
MDALSVEPHALPPRRLPAPEAPEAPGPGSVPVALIIDPQSRVGLGVLPPWVPCDRDAGRAYHLVHGQVQSHVVRRELAVELARRIQRVRFPTEPIVHDDLGIPLREVEAPTLPPLASRQGRRPRLPVDLDHERVPRSERPRQHPVRHRRVRSERIVGLLRRALHARPGDPLECVVGVLQVLEAVPALVAVGGRPAGPGSERIEVLVHVEVAQHVGGTVHVADAHVPREHARRLVE